MVGNWGDKIKDALRWGEDTTEKCPQKSNIKDTRTDQRSVEHKTQGKIRISLFSAKGYLWSSLKRPVPMDIGIPMMIHSLTPEATETRTWMSASSIRTRVQLKSVRGEHHAQQTGAHHWS